MLWAGPPQAVYVDPGSSFASEAWLRAMQSHDIRLHMTATDSHWQLGRTESHGGVLKRMLSRMDAERPIRSSSDFREALTQAVCAKNTLSRIHGYTPEQAVLGIARHLPASVTSSDQAAGHLHAESNSPLDAQFQERLAVRTLARKAFIEADNCSSLRRALLRRSRPVREDYEKGDWVLYWRRRATNLRRELGKWHGPARVILVERRRVVWLSHGARLIRASPEQLRPASLREWQHVQGQPENRETVEQTLARARHHNYVDVSRDDLPEDDDLYAPSSPEPSDGPPGPGLEAEPEPGLELPEPEREVSSVPRGEQVDGVDPVDVPVPEDEFSEEDPVLFGDTRPLDPIHGAVGT